MQQFLRCPKSGDKLCLTRVDSFLVSVSSPKEHSYEFLEEIPILIDFESSILSKSDISLAKSLVPRKKYSGLLNLAKKLIFPPKRKTKENVEVLKGKLCQSVKFPKVLIVGGGTVGQNMEFFYESNDVELVAFDIYASPYVQFVADAHQIPLPSNFFDAVIVQAVLEHVLDPRRVVGEIHRVLKTDGLVYAETPFLQQVHEGAYDFTRFTESGHRYLFKKFKCLDSGTSAGTGTQMLWSLDYFFRGLFRSKSAGKIAKILFFWIRYFDLLIPERFNVDCASGVFFLGEKTDSRLEPKDFAKHYKGAQ